MNLSFLETIINAIPSAILLVDSDVRIRQLNTVASSNLGLTLSTVYGQRGGEALHCIHSDEVPEGCGHAEACRECIIRGSVNMAIQGGQVCRKQTKMQLKKGESVADLHLLVTASPFEFEGRKFVLLILDDITELVQLRSILPICCCCRKIRNDKEYWESLELYMSSHMDIQFSHGLCPDCARKQYPQFFK